MWAENTRSTLYGQWLAWQLTVKNSIDLANGAEPVPVISSMSYFKNKVIIVNKEQAFKETRKCCTGLILWINVSKLDHESVRAAICQKDKRFNCWKDESIFLAKDKDIIEVELWAISKALLVVITETKNSRDISITVFCDS